MILAIAAQEDQTTLMTDADVFDSQRVLSIQSHVVSTRLNLLLQFRCQY